MAKPELALWRGVIEQAIIDASVKSACLPIERAQANDWLFSPNKGFLEVCALADMEPDHVRAHAQKRIEKAANRKRRTPRKPECPVTKS